MALSNPSEVHLPAIVCLDPGGGIWARLRKLLHEDSVSSEFILTRSPESSAKLLALCRRLLPALVVVAEEELAHLPLAGLRDLMGPSGVQILVFSEKTDPAALESFFRQGCSGVLSTRVADETFLKAIRSLFAGELWLPRKLVSQLAREAFLRSPVPKLTRRESDIWHFIGLGQTNQEIADHCFISRETVRWHIRSLYDKIGVDNREGAIREARLTRGVAPSPPAIDE